MQSVVRFSDAVPSLLSAALLSLDVGTLLSRVHELPRDLVDAWEELYHARGTDERYGEVLRLGLRLRASVTLRWPSVSEQLLLWGGEVYVGVRELVVLGCSRLNVDGLVRSCPSTQRLHLNSCALAAQGHAVLPLLVELAVRDCVPFPVDLVVANTSTLEVLDVRTDDLVALGHTLSKMTRLNTLRCGSVALGELARLVPVPLRERLTVIDCAAADNSATFLSMFPALHSMTVVGSDDKPLRHGALPRVVFLSPLDPRVSSLCLNDACILQTWRFFANNNDVQASDYLVHCTALLRALTFERRCLDSMDETMLSTRIRALNVLTHLITMAPSTVAEAMMEPNILGVRGGIGFKDWRALILSFQEFVAFFRDIVVMYERSVAFRSVNLYGGSILVSVLSALQALLGASCAFSSAKRETATWLIHLGLHRHVAHALTLDCGDTCLDFALRLFTSLASVHAFKERVYRQGAAALWALAHRFDSESLLTSTLFGIGNCASSATNARLIAAQANERVPLLMHIMALAPPNAKRPSAVGAAYVLGQAAYADPLGFASADASVFDAIVSHSRANVEPGSSLFSSFWLLWSAAHWLNGRSDAGAAETFCQLDIQFQALHSVRSSLPCLWSTLNGLFALIRSRRTSSFGLWTLHSVALAEEHRPKLLNPNNVTHLFAALRVLDGSLPAIDAHLHPVWALLSQSADAAFLARARRELSAEDWLRLRLDCSSSCL